MSRKKKTTDKSKLIKKHLERVSCKDYRLALKRKQRGRGIYVLYKGDKIYYVGLSKSSLRTRIRNHAIRDRHKGKWDSYSFYQILRPKYIKDVESLLIRVCRPHGNKVNGRFNKKYDLGKAYEIK